MMKYMSASTKTCLLLGILTVGLTLRLWNLSGPDIATDDALYSLRSIGWIDYVASTNKQSTPVTWFDKPVWWQGLSFHDAPPLVFATQWISFQFFGDNAVAARLPFVAAGMLGVYGAFLLANLIAGPLAGLAAAATLAIANYAIWISRIGFLEGFLVPAILFSLYFFLRAGRKCGYTNVNADDADNGLRMQSGKYYVWWGIAVAAGLLTKYSFLFMGPVFLIALLVWRRDAFRQKWFYAGVALIFIFLTPLIVYNAMMYATRGHLDAALSTFVGAHPKDFSVLTRTATTPKDAATRGIVLLYRNMSLGLLALAIAGFALMTGIASADRGRLRNDGKAAYALILLGTIWALIMLAIAGGGNNFGAVLLPFAAVAVGVLLAAAFMEMVGVKRIALYTGLGLLALWELFFAIQSQLISVPATRHPLLRAENVPSFLGFSKLERYVKNFYEAYPELSTFVIFADAPQLASYQEKKIRQRLRKNPDQPLNSHLLVFDDRMKWFAWVWLFERRRLYNFSPIPSLTQFSEKLRTKGARFYADLGFTDVTIITAASADVMDSIKPDDRRTAAVRELEGSIRPIDEIKNAKGDVVFRVFRLGVK
ncbi:MAG: glycosyltransferase family 39 protein [Candidatus Harrisonbacteria bacterium]|nr:glycosyltransferase family 39 protein [Candidatus Harrisonbacteria bacterium]